MVHDVFPSPSRLDMSTINSMLIRHEGQDIFLLFERKACRCPTLNSCRCGVNVIVIVSEGCSIFLAVCSGGSPHLRMFVSFVLLSVMKFNSTTPQKDLLF